MDCSNFSNSSVSVRFRCEDVLARDILDTLLAGAIRGTMVNGEK